MQDWAGFTVHDPKTHMNVGYTYRHRSSAVRRAQRYPVGQVATVQQWDSACEPVKQWRIEGRAET
jgi:hypothetical protein